uniref:Uncharacterized protein n=1 Tax=Noccaea caerulescens TaxID=107243 RepID=A0A1J3JB16_NOCCA
MHIHFKITESEDLNINQELINSKGLIIGPIMTKGKQRKRFIFYIEDHEFSTVKCAHEIWNSKPTSQTLKYAKDPICSPSEIT